LGNADRPWLRTDLPLEQRVEALLGEMTLAEKVGQTHQIANIDPFADRELIRGGGVGSSVLASGATAGNERDPGIDVSGIDAAQRIAVDESRLGIPLLLGRDVIHGHRTVFPIPLGLAATWDEDLVCRTARLAAAEGVTTRRRTLGRLRRELRRVGERDYFPPPEREEAHAAVDELIAVLELAT